jgi:hypothetical protein
MIQGEARKTTILYSEVTSLCQKCNSQATGPGGCPSIPEADTMVERPNVGSEWANPAFFLL